MPRGTVSYLARNNQSLDLGDGGERFSPTLLDVTGKTVFLLGEVHGFAEIKDLDLALLKYLHRTAGVRFYLMEEGPSHAWFINRYLATGDEQMLDVIFTDPTLRGTFGWTREHRTFWKRVRVWNDSLADKERIGVVGVDVEHQPATAAACLRRLLPDAAPPAGISDPIHRIIQFAASTDFKSEGIVAKAVLESLATNRSDYAAYLGDNLFDFELVTCNLRKAYEYYTTPRGAAKRGRKDEIREQACFEAFKRVQGRVPEGRFYGCWGHAHVSQRRFENLDWLATLLNGPESPVTGKILSIWTLYEDGRRMWPDSQRRRYVVDSFSSELEQVRPFTRVARSRVTLFRLTGPGLPFAQQPYLVPQPCDGGGTTNYFQYLILLRGATPTTPLEVAQ
jgi:hypothetical protein